MLDAIRCALIDLQWMVDVVIKDEENGPLHPDRARAVEFLVNYIEANIDDIRDLWEESND